MKKDVKIETYMEPSDHPAGGSRFRTELEIGEENFVISEIHVTGEGYMRETHEALAFRADENWDSPDMHEVVGVRGWKSNDILTPDCLTALINKIDSEDTLI